MFNLSYEVFQKLEEKNFTRALKESIIKDITVKYPYIELSTKSVNDVPKEVYEQIITDVSLQASLCKEKHLIRDNAGRGLSITHYARLITQQSIKHQSLKVAWWHNVTTVICIANVSNVEDSERVLLQDVYFQYVYNGEYFQSRIPELWVYKKDLPIRGNKHIICQCDIQQVYNKDLDVIDFTFTNFRTIKEVGKLNLPKNEDLHQHTIEPMYCNKCLFYDSCKKHDYFHGFCRR